MKRRALWLTLAVLVALCGVCILWVQAERQQYARNSQLIAALEKDDTKTALALVNAGADPNTRRVPLPAPMFQSLLNQLLHHSQPPINNSATAFHIACGDFMAENVLNAVIPAPHEDETLIQAMLAHHASVHAVRGDNITAFHDAIFANRLNTAEMLLQHGADANAPGPYGTPLECAIKLNSVGMVKLLLAHGANLNLVEKQVGPLLLGSVVAQGKTGIVSELLAHGANPNVAKFRLILSP